MAEDIAPELLKKIQEEFHKNCSSNKELQEISKKVADGTANCEDLENYAIAAGEMLAKAMHDNVSGDNLPDGKMYYNIASRIMPPNLEECYTMVADIAEGIYGILNEKAGIHIKALRPDLNKDRIDGLVNYVSNADQYEDVRKSTEQSMVTFSQSVATDAVHKNADFQYKAGLTPKIRRRAEGNCCKWCQSLEGTYDYADVRDTGNDVWRRHRDCRCEVTYDPGTGKVQDAHSKEWRWDEDNKKEIPARIDRDNQMDYKKPERIDSTKIEALGDEKDIVTVNRFMDYGNYKVYISENLDIKPNEMQFINKTYIKWAIEKTDLANGELPRFVLADSTELSSLGRYLYDSNTLFLRIERFGKGDDTIIENNRHLCAHELKHWELCQKFGKDRPDMREAELVPVIRDWAKIQLDKKGINNENVIVYGGYASNTYAEGLYDETYIEYLMSKMLI